MFSNSLESAKARIFQVLEFGVRIFRRELFHDGDG
jgi:hypothetical protein